jgi:hypothetical protein
MIKKLSIFILVLFASVTVYAASQQTSTTTAQTIVDNVETLLNDTDNRMWTEGELLQWLNDGMVDIVSRSQCLQTTETIELVSNQLEYAVTSTYLTVKAVQYIDSDAGRKALLKGSPMSVGLVEDVDEPVYWYDWAGKIGAYPVDSITPTATDTQITFAFVDSDPDTITDSGSGFLTAGFEAGMQISVSGSTSNDGVYTIASAVAGTITLVATDELTAEIAGDTVTIKDTEALAVYLITRPTAIIISGTVTTPAIYDTALTYYIVAKAWQKDLKHAKYLQTMALYEAEMQRLRQDLNDFPAQPIN